MPIKQVTCSVCNTLVNKAQTYSTGKDQRACKSHPGVTEKKGELEAQRFQKAQAAITNMRRRNENFAKSGHPDWSGDSMTPKCWLCMNKGLRSDEFYTRVLIEREKAVMIHGAEKAFNFKLNLGRCIFVLAKEKCSDAMKFIREDFSMLVQMSGVVAICAQCCRTCNIEPIPKMEFEDLLTWSLVAEMVRPAIQKIAVAEMAKVN
jgi:hypothetical protein